MKERRGGEGVKKVINRKSKKKEPVKKDNRDGTVFREAEKKRVTIDRRLDISSLMHSQVPPRS